MDLCIKQYSGSWLYERLTVPTAQCYFNLHSISLVKLLAISVRIAGTLLLLFRSHMYMNILKEIIYVAYDNVYSLFEFLSKPRALDTRDRQTKCLLFDIVMIYKLPNEIQQ